VLLRKITSRGQVTIPREVREKLKARIGDFVLQRHLGRRRKSAWLIRSIANGTPRWRPRLTSGRARRTGRHGAIYDAPGASRISRGGV